MMKGAQARVLPRMDGVFDEKGAERHNAKGRGRFQSLWDGSASGAADRQQPAERSDRFEETYRRGFDDGMHTAHAQRDGDAARIRAEIEAELVRNQQEELLQSIDHLTVSVSRMLAEIEMRLREGIAEALYPLAAASLTQAAHGEMIEAVECIVTLRGAMPLLLRGPAELIAPMQARLAAEGLAVEAVAEEGSVISIDIAETTLQTALPQWLADLEALVR